MMAILTEETCITAQLMDMEFWNVRLLIDAQVDMKGDGNMDLLADMGCGLEQTELCTQEAGSMANRMVMVKSHRQVQHSRRFGNRDQVGGMKVIGVSQSRRSQLGRIRHLSLFQRIGMIISNQ